MLLGTPGDYSNLAVNSDKSYTFTDTDGTQYHFAVALLGQPDYIQDRNGNKLTVTYAAEGGLYPPSLTSVTDAQGHTVTFQYDTHGHITKATDTVGRPRWIIDGRCASQDLRG